MWAVRNGFVAIAQYLLNCGASCSTLAATGDTALLLSMIKGGTPLFEIAKTLIEDKKDDVNQRSNDGASLLLHAAKLGCFTFMRRLLNIGADSNVFDNQGYNPMYYAAGTNRPLIISMLFDEDPDSIDAQDGSGNTPLMNAISTGSIAAAVELLRLHAKVSLVNDNGDSVIFLAASQGYLQILKRIIEIDSNVNLIDNSGNLPILQTISIRSRRCAMYLLRRNIDLSIGENFMLKVASNSDLLGFADILIDLTERGIDINVIDPENGATLLIYAIKNGFVEAARAMIRKGANIAMLDYEGNAAINHAAIKDFVDIIDLSLQQGVFMDRVNKEGDSCFIQSLSKTSLAAARRLLSEGVNIHILREDMSNALMLAASQGQLGIVKLLIERGIKTNLFDYVGDNALMYALQSTLFKARQVAAFLIENNIECGRINDLRSSSLIDAASKGMYEVVKMILEKGSSCDVNYLDATGNSAIVAGRSFSDVVELLLGHGASINIQNETLNAILLENYGRFELVKRYCALDSIDLNLCDTDGNTALSKAVRRHLPVIATLLLSTSQDLNLQENDSGRIAVMDAAVPSCFKLLLLLLDRKCDINHRDSEGNTALHTAIEAGYTDLVKYLILNCGADARIQNNAGKNALVAAVASGIFDIVAFLVESGVDINTRDKEGSTPLLLAIKNRFISIARFLIDSDANIKLKSIEGETPLLASVEKGLFDIAVMLIDKGADVNEVNKSKTSPLVLAIQNKYLNLANELISKGSDIKLIDENGNSAVISSIRYGMTDILQSLLEKGADINLKDKQGIPPIVLAIQSGYADAVKMLMRSKDVDVKLQLTDSGDSALHCAVESGLVDICSLLLARGVEIDRRNKKGVTALIKAIMKGYHRIVYFLLAKEASIHIKNVDGDSAYLTAAALGMSEITKTLAAKSGVDVNQQDKKVILIN